MRLLDLYCGEGGAALGYQQAGYEVVGVDTNPAHRRYYPGRFIAANAIGYLYAHGHEYDLIHASPPCQRYTIGNAGNDVDHLPDLVAPTRKALETIGVPYIMENVVRAPMKNPILLCGTMFNLATLEPGDHRSLVLHLRRHRLFESSLHLRPPRACVHRKVQWAGSYGGARTDRDDARHIRKGGYVPPTKAAQQDLMGVQWHGTVEGLHQAIPPAYTQWLGSLAATQIGTP